MSENFTGDTPTEILDTQLEEKDYRRYEEGFKQYLNMLPDLINKGLEHEDPFIQDISVEMLQYLSEKQRKPLIKKVVQNNNPDLLTTSPKIIQYSPENQRSALIKRYLGDFYLFLFQNTAAEMIRYTPEDQRITLIKEGSKNPNEDVRETSIKMIRYISENLRFPLINKGLDDSDIIVREACMEMIRYVSENQRTFLIRKGLKNSSPRVQNGVAEMIQYAPEDQRATLIREGFKSSDHWVQNTLAKMIKYVPKDQIAVIIKEGLEERDPNVKAIIAEMIYYAPKDQQQHLIDVALKNLEGDFLDQFIQKFNPILTYQSFPLEKKNKLKEIATSTPLYKDCKPNTLKQNFEKTGSSTTLLLGFGLKDKAIIRTINPCSLFPWKKAFENNKYWQENGFNHIPIEPIIGIKPQSRIDKINVMTRVIPGPTIAKWTKTTPIWKIQIEEQRDKIIDGLESLNIEHGHLHNENFVLHFERDDNGEPDISKPPQVYVIDFDASSSKI